MAKVIVGDGKIELSDIASVACLNETVVIDPNVYAKLSSLKNVETQSNVSLPELSFLSLMDSNFDVDEDCIPVKEMRAIIFLKIVSIVRQKLPICKEAIDFLVALLNQGITPRIPISNLREGMDSPCYALIALVMQGKGQCTLNEKILEVSEALSMSHISVVELSPQEISLLSQTSTTLTAITALATCGANGIIQFADAVACLSCEASKMNIGSFDAEYHDLNRPHRGAITCATNLRLLLENSSLANTRNNKQQQGDQLNHPPCFRSIPSYHGAVRDSVEACVRSMQVEINSCEPPMLSNSVGIFHPQPLATILSAIGNALVVMQGGMQDRIANLSKESNVMATTAVALAPPSVNAIYVELENTINLKSILSISQLVDTVTQWMCKEAELSLSMLQKLEEESLASAKVSAKVSVSSSMETKQHAVPVSENLENMSEEKRKKIEEKRAKKLAMQLEKSKAKANKGGLKLGAGTVEFRKWLVVSEMAMDTKLNPYNNGIDSTLAKLSNLLLALGSGGVRRKPKIAKGAQDFLPAQMKLREQIFHKIRSVFKQHGGVEIETPVFELKETLTGKYGEDSKLIYDLADQGGELLALRYDLTVPFARFMAMHNIGNIKRYHISRVYRRDNPQMARGRYREFYQCDFDIAGSYGSMIPDAEVISIGIEILRSFPEIGSFKLKLNHRKLLDAILAICGVPQDKFRSICSAIDKLDKEEWCQVRSEMVDEKGLSPEVADRIEPFVVLKGHPKELHQRLLDEKRFGDNKNAGEAMKELALLFDYLEAMGTLDYVSFDLSLARGLDYYTGVIYEAVLTGETNMGSIGGGGRYDELVGMFSASGQQIPCVGISIGIERLFSLLESHAQKTGQLRQHSCQVLVATTSANLLLERIRICGEIWKGNIAAEFHQSENPKFTKQLHYALETGIPYVVIVGEEELAAGVVKIKSIATKEEVAVPREELVPQLLARGCITTETV